MLIDDFEGRGLSTELKSSWRCVTDQIMGGISEGCLEEGEIDGHPCMRLFGDVCLENNGGFIQAALDLASHGNALDASSYQGLRLLVRGNEEQYSVHLRTLDNVRPWQSYRRHFIGCDDWKLISLPFESFEPHRLNNPLNTSCLLRIGLVAIGRSFRSDLAVAKISFYR